MKPQAGHWLICGGLAALGACLNPLTDDTPSRTDTTGVVPGIEVDSPERGEDGDDITSLPEPPNLQGGENPRPTEEPVSGGPPNAPDAGAADAGSLRATQTATQSDLAADAGADGSLP